MVRFMHEVILERETPRHISFAGLWSSDKRFMSTTAQYLFRLFYDSGFADAAIDMCKACSRPVYYEGLPPEIKRLFSEVYMAGYDLGIKTSLDRADTRVIH